MTESSPADLAVAFRSFARRLREAAAPAEGDKDREAAIWPQVEHVRDLLDRAAGVVGAFPAHDVNRTGAAIGDQIEAIRAEDWDDDRLGRLRNLAIEVGVTLRRIEDVTTR